MKILITNLDLSVCKLQNNKLPDWTYSATFLNYTITSDETSLVCNSEIVPNHVMHEDNWSCIKIDEILDFGMVGVIAKISNLFAEQKISIFVISTYNTDYILLKKDNLELAIDTLKNNFFEII